VCGCDPTSIAGVNSVRRLVNRAFSDGDKQLTLDYFLGRFAGEMRAKISFSDMAPL
jgi:hypothetical protein